MEQILPVLESLRAIDDPKIMVIQIYINFKN